MQWVGVLALTPDLKDGRDGQTDGRTDGRTGDGRTDGGRTRTVLAFERRKPQLICSHDMPRCRRCTVAVVAAAAGKKENMFVRAGVGTVARGRTRGFGGRKGCMHCVMGWG